MTFAPFAPKTLNFHNLVIINLEATAVLPGVVKAIHIQLKSG